MSKITFRADEELVQRLEEFDASKSEVMREALRAYFDGAEGDATSTVEGPTGSDAPVDDALASRIDDLIVSRLDELVNDSIVDRTPEISRDRDVHVNINLSGDPSGTAIVPGDTSRESDRGDRRKTPRNHPDQAREASCGQCGETVSPEHVYCPNCGEKAARRIFCECGDELRSDWGFCPSCGRRTPAADVLDRS